MSRRYPIEPLYELPCYRDKTSREIQKLTGYNDTTVRRWRAAGTLPEPAADRLACLAGFHPGLVWPEWWTE